MVNLKQVYKAPDLVALVECLTYISGLIFANKLILHFFPNSFNSSSRQGAVQTRSGGHIVSFLLYLPPGNYVKSCKLSLAQRIHIFFYSNTAVFSFKQTASLTKLATDLSFCFFSLFSANHCPHCWQNVHFKGLIQFCILLKALYWLPHALGIKSKFLPLVYKTLHNP